MSNTLKMVVLFSLEAVEVACEKARTVIDAVEAAAKYAAYCEVIHASSSKPKA